MSPRPRTTFAKRQKEQARQEKQQAKVLRKQQRKLENQNLDQSGSEPRNSQESETVSEPPVREAEAAAQP